MEWTEGGREAETVRETTALTRLLGMSGTLADHLAGLQRCTCRRHKWRGISKARQELHCTGGVESFASITAETSNSRNLDKKGNVASITPITPKNEERRRNGGGSHSNQAFSTSSALLQEQFGRLILLQLPQNEDVSLSLSLSAVGAAHAMDTIAETELVAVGDAIRGGCARGAK